MTPRTLPRRPLRRAAAALTACAAAAAAFLAAPAPAAADPVGDGWTLKFSDEFDGTELDRNKWVTCWWWATSEADGCTNGGNPQVSYVRERNVSVSDGALHLKAVREKDTVGDRTYDWTSGMVSTGRIGNATADNPVKYGFTYGYMEARMRFSAGNGAYSAFWATPSDNGWPPEIDVVERLGDRGELAHQTHHWGSGETRSNKSQEFLSEALKDGQYHTVGVDWQPGQLVWYVDGREVNRSLNPEGVAAESMHLLLSTEIWGKSGWTNGPDASTPSTVTTDVDYVRVWQRSDGNPEHEVPLPAQAPVASTFGTSGTSGATGPAALFDGNTSTAYDASSSSACHAGVDTGASRVVDQVRFWGRTGADVKRTVGGMVQASASPDGPWTTLHTIKWAIYPGRWVTAGLDNTTAYRYYRYVGPANGHCNMAELVLRTKP